MLALVLGGIAAFLARSWMLSAASGSAAPTGTIVVASRALNFGTVLTRDNLSEIPWPNGALPDGAFATRNELLKDGRRALLAPLARSEAVLKSKVTGPDQRASLSALLDQDQRAVTVRVDDVRGVAGFVLPGDRVDVVLIRTVERPNSRPENISEVLLATNIGKLSLILRQSGASDPTVVRPVSEKDLALADKPVGTAPAKAAAQAHAPAAGQNSQTVVEVVRSMKIEKYNVLRME
jgi:pilus assembly protein CpaB